MRLNTQKTLPSNTNMAHSLMPSSTCLSQHLSEAYPDHPVHKTRTHTHVCTHTSPLPRPLPFLHGTTTWNALLLLLGALCLSPRMFQIAAFFIHYCYQQQVGQGLACSV